MIEISSETLEEDQYITGVFFFLNLLYNNVRVQKCLHLLSYHCLGVHVVCLIENV